MGAIDIECQFRAIIDTLEAHIAIVDRNGVIQATNAAWEQFCTLDGRSSGDCGVGGNYLANGLLNDQDGVSATAAISGITSVLNGTRSTFSMDYPSHIFSDDVQWFRLDVKSLPHGSDGAVIMYTDVTAVHQAQSEAVLRERRFASLLRHAMDLVTVIGPTGLIVYQSPGVEHVLDYRPEELIGTSGLALLHPSDLGEARRALTELYAIPYGTTILELRIRHRDGTWRWIESTFTNFVEDSMVQGIAIHSRSIAERNAELIAQSEQVHRFTSFFHGTSEAMGIHDGNAYVQVNKALGALIGLDPAELIGLDPLTYVAPESQSFTRSQMMQQVEEPYQILASRHDGSTYPAEIFGRPIQYGGKWLRLLTVRDVTKRFEIEEALRASEARFRALVQESSEIVVVFDAKGGLRYSNPALEWILGFPAETYREGLRMDLVHPDDIGLVEQSWAAVMEVPRAPLRYTFRSRNAEGTWVWLEGILTNLLDDPAVEGIVFNARDVSTQKHLEDELRHLALHDPLTGLPNRNLMTDRLDQALRLAEQHRGKVSILFIDLDNFKFVNDKFGHAAGDTLLSEIARRMNSELTVSETLARIGGDEFVVLIPGNGSGRNPKIVADCLREAMNAPFTWQDNDVSLTLSIGIATSRNGKEKSEILLHHGDAALYKAKKAGRGRYVMYANGMSDDANRRSTLESDMRRAAERGEFELNYQPIVNLASGCIAQVEALLRWTHPTYGPVPPDEFIPLAEETGQIVQIGEWVLKEACRQLVFWGTSAPEMAVNVSAAQFREPGLVELISTELDMRRIDPKNLHIEITEGVLIDDVGVTITTLQRLRDLGISVTIDDFGTGYSSLRYLRDLPVDAIKIDHSFVRGLESDAGALAIVEGITSLAHAIGLSVTAEGIETSDQLTRLIAVGCDRGQGYFLAKPAPAKATAPRFTVSLPPVHTIERVRSEA